MNEYAKFIDDLISALSHELKKGAENANRISEVGRYAVLIKKEAYCAVFEEEIDPEKFLAACHRYLECRSEDAKAIIAPILRDFKLNILNIEEE